MADDDHTESDCLFLVDCGCSFYAGFIVESDRSFCFYQHGFSWGGLPARQCYIFLQRFMRREPVFII